MPVVPGPLRQVALPVADVERSVAFYGDMLGLPLVARFGPLAFFDMGGVRLLVEQADDVTRASVLYFAVDDIHAAHAALAAAGVDTVDEPHLIHRDDAGAFGPAGDEEWMTFFHDPDGHVLALASRRRPDG